MPTRELLTPTQRLPFLGIPADLSERAIARYYTFTDADLALILQRRRAANRLGFAVQLAVLRYPGFPWQPSLPLPPAVLSFIAVQIGEVPSALTSYALREPTRFEHLAELQRVYGYQTFTRGIYRKLAAWIMPLALSTDRGLTLVEALVEELRARNVLLPALSTLERLAWETRRRALRQIYATLAGALSEEQRLQLDALLRVPAEDTRTPLVWLREPPGPARATAFLKVTERIHYLRGLGLDPAVRHRVHAQRLRQLAREGEKYTPQFLERFAPLRRHATLVAYLLETAAQLTDAALEMHDRIIGQIFAHGQKAHLAQFEQRGRDINKTVRLYARVGQALIHAREEGRDAYAALERVLPWQEYVVSVGEAEAQARPDDFDYLDLLDNFYGQVRKYVPQLLDTFTFRATPAGQPVVEALNLIHTLGPRKKIPDAAPAQFVKPRWEPYVFAEGGIDRHYYELCALAELRNGLRSGDIWVDGSHQYREFDTYLLPTEEWTRVRAAEQVPLGVPTDCAAYLAERRQHLHAQLTTVAALLEANQLPGVRLDGHKGKDNGKEKAHFAPLDAEMPPGVEELARSASSRMRHIKITELLAEIDACTHFSRHFTHLHTGAAPDDRVALFAALLAEATNLGPAKMADATPGMTFKRLTWVTDWYLRDECYTKALADIVNFHHRLAFSVHWGDGTTSSSDGQRFPVGGRKSATASVNARYGSEPGILFITHISDQHGPYHTKAVTGTAREAPYLVDGLLYHETELPIHTHSADTGGYTDQIFGICALLGFRFAPRLRDVGDRKRFPFERPKTYPALEQLIGGTINVKQIEAHWDDLLRLAASLKLGTGTASLLLRKLAAYPRQNGLAWALREVGRVERTLYLLAWYQDLDLRRQVLISLNKGEGRNALARAVFFYRRGTVQERAHLDQQERAQGLNLVVAAIILWNTLELDRVIGALRAEGVAMTEEQLQHLSPMDWEHISLTGDYLWEALRPAAARTAQSARTAAKRRRNVEAAEVEA